MGSARYILVATSAVATAAPLTAINQIPNEVDPFGSNIARCPSGATSKPRSASDGITDSGAKAFTATTTNQIPNEVDPFASNIARCPSGPPSKPSSASNGMTDRVG